MLLRAWDLKGDKSYEFTLYDCPVIVTEAVLALANSPKSKLLSYQSIVRGDEETGFFEGDEVYENGELSGYIIYSGGFKLQTLSHEIKCLKLNEHIEVRKGNKKSIKCIVDNPQRTMLRFKYEESGVSFRSFVLGVKSGYIGLCIKRKRVAVRVDSLLFDTGITREGRPIYFGEQYGAGVVVLHDGLPCIRMSDFTYQNLV